MSAGAQLLLGLCMVVGLIGVVVPVLPGLFLMWATGIAWAWLDGGGVERWTVAAVLTVLLVMGTTLTYLLPARSAAGAGAPRSTLVLGALGAFIGFFAIPFLGFVIGGVGVIFLVELARMGSAAGAWRSTRAVLVGIGIGMLVELGTAVLMLTVWLLGVVVT